MRDFFYVRSVAEVIAHIRSLPPLPVEDAPLIPDTPDTLEGPKGSKELDSLDGLEGRVLAADIIATDDVPLTSRSGMDGFAVRAADIFGATESNPAYLTCVGHCAIDAIPLHTLLPGQCLGIVTGGILPQGADAVVMVEHTHAMSADCIEVRRPVPPGEHVMLRGEDVREGNIALPAGTVLRAQEIGLLAAVGATCVSVHRRPVAAILSTGDEVIPAHAKPRPGQVRDVNTHTLAALVRRAGGVPRLCGIIPDTLDALETGLHLALAQADTLFISGGSSVGIRDLTLAALARLPKSEIYCHGVALSPGKPLIIAHVGNKTVWGLPGQVASAQIVMMVLGQPFLRWLAGQAHSPHSSDPFEQSLWPQIRARLTRNIASRQGREDYIRIRLETNNTTDTDKLLLAVPVPGMSGILRTLLNSQGIIRINARLEGLEAGELVDVLLFG